MKDSYITTKNLLYIENENMLLFENDLFSLNILFGYFLDLFLPEHSYTQPMHTHINYELHMVLRGYCQFETPDNKNIVVNEGNFILVPPVSKHRITFESTDFSKVTLRFDMTPKITENANFYQTAESLLDTVKVFPYSQQMKDLVAPMVENATKRPHQYKTVIFTYIIAFVIETLRVVVGKTKISPSKKYKDSRINNAVDYIKNNISASLTVADVANHIHMSSKHFTRIFIKELGVTPGNYIRDFKIERIRKLILTANLPLDDIADIMGYSDSTSLIKAFKRVEGNTPLQYKAAVTREN